MPHDNPPQVRRIDIPPNLSTKTAEAALAFLASFVDDVQNVTVKAATKASGSAEYYTAKNAPMLPTTFKRHGKAGAYPLVMVGREYRAPRSEVDAWLARQPTAATSKAATEASGSDAAPNTHRSAEELFKLEQREQPQAPKQGPRRR